MNLNPVAFFIFATSNIKNLSALPIDDLSVLVLKDLPPIRVGAPDSHFRSFSNVVYFQRLVVQSGSDGQRLLMEVPDLGSSAIWSLDDNVSVVDEIEVSIIWEFRNEMEISLNVESELFVELSFSRFFLIFVNIDYSPSLVNFSILILYNDVSVFGI